MNTLFYFPDIEVAVNSKVLLNEEESNHCVRVLRLNQGDSVYLTNGKGVMFRAVIVRVAPKACWLRIEERFDRWAERPYYLHLAVAPTKNSDRYEWMVEKVTEVGVDEITPIIAARSERREFKTDRIQRIAISAMKQSIKAQLPVIHPIVSFDSFINKSFDGIKLIAHCGSGARIGLNEALIVALTAASAAASVNAQIKAPVESSAAAPVESSAAALTAAQVNAHIKAPVETQVNASAAAPVESLAAAPVESPAEAPQNGEKSLRCLVLIGPEGDFTPDEVAQAEANGFQSIHLGTSRLRTETAAIVAASAIYLSLPFQRGN